MPVNVFLIEHPAGLCLFDTGQTARAALPGYFPSWYPFFRLARFELAPGDEAAPQLRRMGVEPSKVRWVVLSHLHTDHVGDVGSFSYARVVVARDEWARATGTAGRLRGYLPHHWPTAIEPWLIDFEGPALGPFSGSFDLAGDGRLVLLPAPGHTPGHMAMLVRNAGRAHLLCGDLTHSASRLATEAPHIEAFCRQQKIVPLTTHDELAEQLLATGTW